MVTPFLLTFCTFCGIIFNVVPRFCDVYSVLSRKGGRHCGHKYKSAQV